MIETIESTDASFVYVFTATGVYPVNLTVSNVNGTDSELLSISVQRKSNSGTSGERSGTGNANVISSKTAKDVEVNKTAENKTDTEIKSHNNDTVEETKIEVLEIEK